MNVSRELACEANLRPPNRQIHSENSVVMQNRTATRYSNLDKRKPIQFIHVTNDLSGAIQTHMTCSRPFFSQHINPISLNLWKLDLHDGQRCSHGQFEV
jgi:hypothetical protein